MDTYDNYCSVIERPRGNVCGLDFVMLEWTIIICIITYIYGIIAWESLFVYIIRRNFLTEKTS